MLVRLNSAVSYLILITLIVSIHVCDGSENVTENKEELDLEKTPENVHQVLRVKKARSMSAVLGNLDPLGVWKSATRIVQKGVRSLREGLQEGVKVAQMLKDDVDEGVTQIWGTKDDKLAEGSTLKAEVEGHSLSDNQEDESDQQILREGMFGGILRFMNVDSSRLGIIALNVLIFVAEMITSTLLGKDSNVIPETRALKTNFMEWVVTGRNKMLDNLITDATSSALPEKLLKTLQDKTGNSTSCVQLLVCKMSPLIQGIQKTVHKQLHGRPQSRSDTPRSGFLSSATASMSSVMDDIYSSVPSRDQFVKFGDECETRYPSCKLLKFSKKSS